MTEVYVPAKGYSKQVYHVDRECYYLEKAERVAVKQLNMIRSHYLECRVCGGSDE